MTKTFALSAAAAFCASALVFSSESTSAQDLRYSNKEYRFAVITPATPMARDVTFTTRSGTAVPAKQFYVEQGAEQLMVTIVQVAEGPAVDEAQVEHAAAQLRQKGEVKFQYEFNYDPGVPGRQINLMERDGRQLRASIYMWDHRLFITEARAPPGSSAALQFEQSITLLDARGGDLDLGRGN